MYSRDLDGVGLPLQLGDSAVVAHVVDGGGGDGSRGDELLDGRLAVEGVEAGEADLVRVAGDPSRWGWVNLAW